MRSKHHSPALPNTSKSPSGLGRSEPTGQHISLGLLAKAQAYWGIASSSPPKKRLVVVPARQAYSHSASVGKR